MNERHLDKVLAQEPDLKFVGAQYLADHKVVGAVIAKGRSTSRKLPAFSDNDSMSFYSRDN